MPIWRVIELLLAHGAPAGNAEQNVRVLMSTTSTRQGILSLTLKDRAALYSAYMMYMQNGAIFVPTPKRYFLGNGIFVADPP